jgi:hypothetical protein
MKEKEYETLRKEILQWQNQRFAIGTGSLVVVFAILGWAITASEKWAWPVLSSVILALLVLVAYLSWLMGLFSSRISTYLEVFHETDFMDLGWERRHRIPHRNFLTTKGAYAALYFGLGVVSCAVSFTVCRAAPTRQSFLLFGFFVLVFVLMLMVLIFKSHPWDRYLQQWRRIKASEEELAVALGSPPQAISAEEKIENKPMSNHDPLLELRKKAIDTAIEWSKQITTLATGALVLSGTFIKDLFTGHVKWSAVIVASWIAMSASAVMGTLYMGALVSMVHKAKSRDDLNIYSWKNGRSVALIHIIAFMLGVLAFVTFITRNML